MATKHFAPARPVAVWLVLAAGCADPSVQAGLGANDMGASPQPDPSLDAGSFDGGGDAAADFEAGDPGGGTGSESGIDLDPNPDLDEVLMRVWAGTARAFVLPTRVHGRETTRFVLDLEPSRGSVWHAGRGLHKGDLVEVSGREGPTFVYRAAPGAPEGEDRLRWRAEPDDGGPSVRLPYRALLAAPPIGNIGGLVMWLDAAGDATKNASGEPAAPGEPIAAWHDRSPLGQHAVLAQGATPPVFDEGAVRMAGGSESLVSQAHFLKSGPGMSYVAALRLDPSATRELRGVVATASARSGLFTGENLLFSRSFPSWSAASLVADRWNVTVSSTDYRVAQGHRVYINGALASADQEHADLLDTSTKPTLRRTRIGDTLSSLDQAFDGWIGEVMLFASPLAPSDQRLIERYLASKWSSAVIHDLRDAPGAWAKGWADEPDFMIAGKRGAVLLGEGGDDVLVSGSGDDELSGGAGADRYLFAEDAAGFNIIRDFDPSEGDVIDLSGALADADGGLSQHIVAYASPNGTLVTVDKDGGESFAADFAFEVPVAELDLASLLTGIKTSPTGLVSLALSLSSQELAVPPGQPERLVLTGVYDHAPFERRIISDDVLYGASLDRAAIDARGVLWGLSPGTTTVSAWFGGLQAELEIDVLPSLARPFVQVGETMVFGTERAAHQGLVFLGDEIFVSGNVRENPQGLNGHIFRADRAFVIQQQAAYRPESFGLLSHIGALDVYGGKLWATFMDLDDQSRSLSVGLVRVDPVSLELETFVDLTPFSAFQDAICFAGDSVWLAPKAGLLVRAPMSESGPDMEAALNYRIHGGIGAVQGLTCRPDALYVVPENSTSNPAAMGIAYFDVRAMVPEPRVPDALGLRKGLRPYNVPEYRFAVGYPNQGAPYQESFAFDPDDEAVIYLPFISSVAENLVELRLEP